MAALEGRLGVEFAAACAILLACTGRIVVTGMGKSGHVAHKIAATLASTGSPAFFLHPAEASHGDIGMITDRGRGAGAVQFWRDRRTGRDTADHQAPGRADGRPDRGSQLDAGPQRGRCARRQRAGGSVPTEPRTDREHHRGARDGRRARGRAARGARLHRRGLRAFAPGRQPRSPAAAARRGRDAPGRRVAGGRARTPRCATGCSR